MPAVKDVIDRLHRHYQPDEHIAVGIWCEEDVLDRADAKNMKVTIEEAREILDTIHDKQDCSLGMSWEAIDCYLDDLKL